MKYHKLVRDWIPQIIESTGKQCKTQILSDEQYLQMLDEKLAEELGEYQESHCLEELADLYEVMRAVVQARGWDMDQLEAVRLEKYEKRGGFHRRILLTEVED